jgi:hypothetical protein
MNTTQYTLVWGFYSNSNMLTRETFADRKACMARVLELQSLRCTPYVGSPERKMLAVLEVYGPSREMPGLRAKTRFSPHTAGSKFIRWTDAHGQGWASSTANLSGESFG